MKSIHGEKIKSDKIGNVHLKWAFSEGAVLFLRNNERGQRWHDKLVQRYGKAKVRFAIEFVQMDLDEHQATFLSIPMMFLIQQAPRIIPPCRLR